jgi:hypothetical protein
MSSWTTSTLCGARRSRASTACTAEPERFMKVSGLRRRAGPRASSALFAFLKATPQRRASRSTTRNPALCRVSA